MMPKERPESIIGRTVRLRTRLTTFGGHVFERGTEMRVAGYDAGRYRLQEVHGARGVSAVGRGDFELFEEEARCGTKPI